jgi:hypothetical protein
MHKNTINRECCEDEPTGRVTSRESNDGPFRGETDRPSNRTQSATGRLAQRALHYFIGERARTCPAAYQPNSGQHCATDPQPGQLQTLLIPGRWYKVMSSYRILRNRKADTSEVGSSEVEREKLSQVSLLDEDDDRSDRDSDIAANQVPPTSSEQAPNETARPQQTAKVLPQIIESDQMAGSLHTILAERY